jgi:hypothetical protein
MNVFTGPNCENLEAPEYSGPDHGLGARNLDLPVLVSSETDRDGSVLLCRMRQNPQKRFHQRFFHGAVCPNFCDRWRRRRRNGPAKAGRGRGSARSPQYRSETGVAGSRNTGVVSSRTVFERVREALLRQKNHKNREIGLRRDIEGPNEYFYTDVMMHRFHNQIGKACALAAATLILPVLASRTDYANKRQPFALLRAFQKGPWSCVVDYYFWRNAAFVCATVVQ